MGLIRSLLALAISIYAIEARLGQHYRHSAAHNQRRQVGASVMVAATSPLGSGIIAIITPSAGAAPVTVTSQSQSVTSYVAQFTLCELPFAITPMPSVILSTPRYRNISTQASSTDSCSTIYSPTVTLVCATTLTGLASKIPVTDCAQNVTFSSEYGYILVTPTLTPSALPASTNMAIFNATGVSNSSLAAMITPPPAIQTLTTYFIAPWAELTAGTAPSDVTRKVCTTFANGTHECIETIEVWRTSLVTQAATSTISLDFTATVHGPSQMIVLETFVANITELLTTVELRTSVETEYVTEIEVTVTVTAGASASTAPTVHQTRTVEDVSGGGG